MGGTGLGLASLPSKHSQQELRETIVTWWDNRIDRKSTGAARGFEAPSLVWASTAQVPFSVATHGY